MKLIYLNFGNNHFRKFFVDYKKISINEIYNCFNLALMQVKYHK